MSDSVNHPSHYNQGKIEVIEFLEDKNLGFHLANVVKYVARAGKKDPSKELEDLKKAQWYLNRYIEFKFADKPRRPNEMVMQFGATAIRLPPPCGKCGSSRNHYTESNSDTTHCPSCGWTYRTS
jgi:predicted Zn-ribbon and HTH transcriptional regulator